MATIITKNSQTASAVPSAASLSVGELAVNTADGKLYTEHTGGVVKEIIPSTVVDGGITTAKIVDANVTGAKLENSGVTAGSYGSASVIPVVTVDAKGRLTSVTTASIPSSAPTTAQVLSATAGASVGDVGTYAMLCYGAVSGTPANKTITEGSTVAGSTLRYGGLGDSALVGPGTYSVNNNFTLAGGTPSGTWRCMGRSLDILTESNSTYFFPNLWLRIS
jgi:hypothetical protein